jgi:predicted PhzF superfamily epimerase YddE/YHI9
VRIPIHQVDAFTAEPFRGNPAAVCLLEEPLPDAVMQAVAAEMNLSETAFLLREGDAWRLRWFTPATEVDLCGHATLAAAHVLGEEAPRFLTKSGELRARRRDDGWIELDFPALPPREEPAPAGLLDALGTAPVYTGTSRFDRLVELESEDAVRAVAPDFVRLAAVDTRGVIVTSRAAGDGFDFVSRFFCPAVGIDEDPVTGSAHCVLAPFWTERLGRAELTGFQASARGGVVRVRVEGDRTLMAGQAVTIMEGALLETGP